MSKLSIEARELLLFVENDSQLYHSQFIPIVKNLMAKVGRGTYDHAKAVKLFMYLAESGAKKYVKEYSDGTFFGLPSASAWHQMFSVADRKQVATALRDTFETEAELGNYDQYLPKKY